MTWRLIVREEAEADIPEAALWYEGARSGLGADFVGEVRRSLQWVQLHPEVLSTIRRKPLVRRILTRRFPYRIFYFVRSDTVVVFAVLHAARDEGTWRERL